ncbi:MAG TPA: Maf family protein [Rhizomicrobium sp.]
MNLVLASGSASRKAILGAAGVPFAAIPADIDERGLTKTLLAGGTPADGIALELAEAKARSVALRHRGALVLGADQTLLLDREVIAKSADLVAARALLCRLRGRAHRLAGGMVLLRGDVVVWRHGDTARLAMRDFSDAFLDRYLAAEGESLLAAVGCYRLEGPGAQLFESIEGDYFSILGLSLQPLLAELRKQGVLAS